MTTIDVSAYTGYQELLDRLKVTAQGAGWHYNTLSQVRDRWGRCPLEHLAGVVRGGDMSLAIRKPFRKAGQMPECASYMMHAADFPTPLPPRLALIATLGLPQH